MPSSLDSGKAYLKGHYRGTSFIRNSAPLGHNKYAPPKAAERGGNNIQRFMDFYLEAKA